MEKNISEQINETNISDHVNSTDKSVDSNETIIESCGPSPFSLEQIIILSTLCCITCLVTTLANLAVFLAFYIERKLQRASNYFLLSISASGFLISLISVPVYTYYILNGSCWHKELGSEICKVWLSLDFAACQMVRLSVLYLIIDRYKFFKDPIKYWQSNLDKKITVLIVGTWFFIFVYTFILFIPQPHVEYRLKCDIYFLQDLVISGIHELWSFYIPVALMAIYYIRIRKIISKKRTLQGQSVSNNNNISLTEISATEKSPTVKSAVESPIRSEFVSKPTSRKQSKPIGLTNNDEMESPMTTAPCNNPNEEFIQSEKRTVKGFSTYTEDRAKNAIRTTEFIIWGCVLCWSPFHVFFVIIIPLGLEITGPVNILYIISYFLCYIPGSFSPFIYAYANQDFKNTFLRIMQFDLHKR